jgi:hypothetical protein
MNLEMELDFPGHPKLFHAAVTNLISDGSLKNGIPKFCNSSVKSRKTVEATAPRSTRAG